MANFDRISLHDIDLICNEKDLPTINFNCTQLYARSNSDSHHPSLDTPYSDNHPVVLSYHTYKYLMGVII